MAATTKTKPTAKHDISLCGLTGLIFAILTTALVLFLEGFVTASWAVEGSVHQGLWHTCERKDTSPSGEWFKAVRVFACLSLISIVLSFLLITYYMKSHVCKNFVLITLTVFSFISAIFMLVTVGVFGAHGLQDGKRGSWSYWVVVVAAVLSLLAALLCVTQIRKFNVRDCIGASEE